MPDFDAAFRVCFGDKVRRGAREGRLLARLSPEQVAAACRIPEAVVRLYSGLFFDVADCLNAEDFILSEVVGWHRRDLTGRDADVFLRYAGYLLGATGTSQKVSAAIPFSPRSSVVWLHALLSR